MVKFIALCIIIFSVVMYFRDKYFRDKAIDKQRQEIEKFKNISEYIIANEKDIILTKINKDLAWFKLGFIDIEIYLGSETFVEVNGINFGHNTELSNILKEIYYRDREKFII